jgi:hypothetical protein
LWGAPRIRVAQTRNRDHRADHRQIHAAPEQASVPDLANIPGKPRQEHGVGGLLQCAPKAYITSGGRTHSSSCW